MDREHNPLLIPQLKNDHKQLFNIYKELDDLFVNSDNYEILVEKLIQLKVMLDMHVDFEDTLLYSYLNTKYKHVDSKLFFINNSNREMSNILKVALKFIEECSNPELYTKHKDKFKKELELIGDILIKRVEFEEDRLYPLYTP